MGRGRQKAKQTKVARALKYTSYEPNYTALERELRGGGGTDVATKDNPSAFDEDDDLDRYAKWIDLEDDEDDEDDVEGDDSL